MREVLPSAYRPANSSELFSWALATVFDALELNSVLTDAFDVEGCAAFLPPYRCAHLCQRIDDTGHGASLELVGPNQPAGKPLAGEKTRH